ncbi:MAG: ABC transporter permease [Lachnospiraceae bacterium]|nr:ABC transporter permease [Lachnospiraceae bacterium]
MNQKIIFHDMRKNLFTTIVTVSFIAASAMLVSLALLLGVNLLTSVDQLMKKAETPHFLQMHAGTLEQEEREAVKGLGEGLAEKEQVLEFLNIENSKIVLNGNSLRDSTQDNGLCVQSDSFDYLLGMENEILKPKDGEIYVPVCYQKEYDVNVGDTADICGKTFVVAGFLRDSQMNSMLASSKRFLVSKADFEMMKEHGSMEYLIEYRLNANADISEFASMYASEKLPANGPAITYPLIKMLSALSDGIMIGILLLVSVLVVVIALLCIRFTLLAKLEEDKKETGVLLALGTPLRDVKKMYLFKYLFLAFIGAMIGMMLTYGIKGKMLSEIKASFGIATAPGLEFLWGFFGAAVVILIVLLSVKRMLKRLEKLSVVEVIQNREDRDKGNAKKVNKMSLSHHLNFSVNNLLAVKDVRVRGKLYVTNFFVFLFAIMLMTIPQNIETTISSEKFSTCMGIGDSDIRFDIQNMTDSEKRGKELLEVLKKDERIEDAGAFFTKTFSVKKKEGGLEQLLIEIGNHQMFSVVYTKGEAPENENEIALSSLNAEEMGAEPGDVLTLVTEDGEKMLTVCGIYSDITNGGKTAKACFVDENTPVMWGTLYATVRDKDVIEAVTKDYAKHFSDVKVTDIRGYMLGTYGSTITSIRKAAVLSVVLAIGITCLLTLLFARLLLAKDRYEVAVLKSCGFTTHDIKEQYIISIVIASIPGILFGIAGARILGERITGLFLSTLGADAFSFVANPWIVYLVMPLLLVGSLMIGSILGTKQVEKIPAGACVKE